MKLNLGCGKNVKEGWLNLDYFFIFNKDVIKHNLDKYPYPFKDKQFSYILAMNIIEHLKEPIKAINECYRILEDGGKIDIYVPHYSQNYGFTPVHRTFWCSETFKFFLKSTIRQGEIFGNYSKLKIELIFPKGLMVWNYLIEYAVNHNEKMLFIWEHTLSFIFRAFQIRAILTK